MKKLLLAALFAAGIAAVSFAAGNTEVRECCKDARKCCADKAECCKDAAGKGCCKDAQKCCSGASVGK